MINMDGRMYDPVVGRFISADPFVQSPDFTQSLNRYAYCINNPLSLIDPSGYSWFSKNWKSLFASVAGIAVSVVTAGSGSGIGAAIIASTAGGAAGALTGALLNGANIGQIAKSTFTGAFWGGLAGAANNLAGDINNFWLRIGTHTLSEGTMEGLQGGNMLHGFMMGTTSSLGGSFIDNNLESLGKIGEVAANSILSGTVDEIGGGKFANGAITGAFTIMFNDMMHEKIESKGEYQRLAKIDKPLEPVYPEFVVCFLGKGILNLLSVGPKLLFTQHGEERALERGFTRKDIKKIIRHGTSTSGKGRYGTTTTKYKYKGNTVVLNNKRQIITTFSNAEAVPELGRPKGYIIK